MGEIIALVVCLGTSVLTVVSAWMIFVKANEPGWACMVPIYNGIVMLKICGKPIWWIVLFLIPGVNVVAALLVNFSLAKSFGKDVGFAIGLVFLTPIFLPLLAFSDATYQGPAG